MYDEFLSLIRGQKTCPCANSPAMDARMTCSVHTNISPVIVSQYWCILQLFKGILTMLIENRFRINNFGIHRSPSKDSEHYLFMTKATMHETETAWNPFVLQCIWLPRLNEVLILLWRFEFNDEHIPVTYMIIVCIDWSIWRQIAI